MAEAPLQKLSDVHRRILDLHIAGVQGIKIAKEFSCSASWVSFVINDSLGQEYILEKRAKYDAALQTAQERVYGALNAAIDCLEDNLKNMKKHLGEGKRLAPTDMQCIAAILKYSGLDPEKGSASGRSDGLFDKDDLDRIKAGPRIIPQTPPLEGEEDDHKREAEVEEVPIVPGGSGDHDPDGEDGPDILDGGD